MAKRNTVHKNKSNVAFTSTVQLHTFILDFSEMVAYAGRDGFLSMLCISMGS